MCARTSYGPGAGLSPRARRGVRNARLSESISRETTSFVPILLLMQNIWVWLCADLNSSRSKFWALGLA